MSHADNMQRDVLVMNLELQLEEKMQKHYGKSLKDGTKEEVYYAVLEATKDLASVMDENDGEKILYGRTIFKNIRKFIIFQPNS